MFLFILKIIILIYIIISIYSLINNQKYNLNGVVLEVESKDDFLNKINTLNPIKFKYNHNYNIENIPENIIQDGNIVSLKKLYNLDNKSINIRKNYDIFYYNDNDFILSIKNNSPINIKNSYIEIYKKSNHELKRSINNYTILSILDGETTLYLFNPKHKNDIMNKKNNEIKKWAHKLLLKKNDCILIPINWYYIQEINNKTIQNVTLIDNIFTYIPNYIKDNIYYIF